MQTACIAKVIVLCIRKFIPLFLHWWMKSQTRLNHQLFMPVWTKCFISAMINVRVVVVEIRQNCLPVKYERSGITSRSETESCGSGAIDCWMEKPPDLACGRQALTILIGQLI